MPDDLRPQNVKKKKKNYHRRKGALETSLPVESKRGVGGGILPYVEKFWKRKQILLIWKGSKKCLQSEGDGGGEKKRKATLLTSKERKKEVLQGKAGGC